MTTMTRHNLTRYATLVALVFTLASVAWLAYNATASKGDEGEGTLVGVDFGGPPPPASLSELIDESTIVAIGRRGDLIGTDKVYPDDYDPEAEPPPAGVDIGVPFSNFKFEVSEYLVGDGPSSLVLRQLGDASGDEPAWTIPTPPEGEELLIFLTPVRRELPGLSDVYRATAGTWGQILASGGHLKYVDGSRVAIIKGSTIQEAAQEVRATAE